MFIVFLSIFIALFIIMAIIFIMSKIFNHENSQSTNDGFHEVINSSIEALKNTGNKIIDGVESMATVADTKCPNCGASISNEQDKFCEYCGSRIPRKSRFSSKKN